MEFQLPLEKMTTEEKLAAMEKLWDDLCQSPESISSPPWHEEVLLEREKRVRDGAGKFSGFAAAKDRIRKANR
jgi:hypothetical protein